MTTAVRAPRPTPRRAPATGPDLRVVGPPRPRPRGGLAVVAVGTIVFLALLGAAVAHSATVTAQVHLDDVSSEVRKERSLLEREKLRLADHQSPVRIAREAKQLGMVPTREQRWLSPGTGAEPLVIDANTPGATPDGTGTDATATDKTADDATSDDATSDGTTSGSSPSSSGSSSSGSSSSSSSSSGSAGGDTDSSSAVR